MVMLKKFPKCFWKIIDYYKKEMERQKEAQDLETNKLRNSQTYPTKLKPLQLPFPTKESPLHLPENQPH